MKPALTEAAMVAMKAENAALKREMERLNKLFADHEKRIGRLETDGSKQGGDHD